MGTEIPKLIVTNNSASTSRLASKIAVSLSGSREHRSVNPRKPKVVSIVFGPEKVLLAEEDPLLDELPLVGEWPLTLDLSKER